jgi:myosin-1
MIGDMKVDMIQDLYHGQKLRRKDSVSKWYLGDYLHLQDKKIMHKIMKKYGDSKILYSGEIQKINKRYAIQPRKIIITDQAIYNLEPDGYGINRRIPIMSVDGVAVSCMRDNFFVLRVPGEYDYLFSSTDKTEIIKTISDQYKKFTSKELPIHVDNMIVYSPMKKQKSKGVKTIEFRDEEKIDATTLEPTETGLRIRVNNADEAPKEKKDLGVQDTETSVFSGRKVRNKTSIDREYVGDYLRFENNPNLKNILKQFGDKKILFSANISKVNKKFKQQERILVITEDAVYNIEPNQFSVQRRMKLDEIEGVSVSSLPDGYFCLHMPGSYDYLLASDKKTEIIDLLTKEKERKGKQLQVNVGDKFEYSPSGSDVQSVSFVLDENQDSGYIEGSSNGLVIHVTHDEPAAVLEAAFLHIKDQQKPIEVKSESTLIKLKKKWKYKLEIRFFCNDHIEGASFHEKIDTVSSRQEYTSQIGTLIPRDERYVIILPERPVIFSVLSKTRVKAKLVGSDKKVLLAVRFVYDVK